MTKKKIAIFCGGPSQEHDVSINSAKNILSCLDPHLYESVICYISKDLNAKIIKDGNLQADNLKTSTKLITVLDGLKKNNFFALLAGIHGEFGEDGQLQALLDFEKIPYSGSSAESSALCTDKTRSMMIADSLGFKTPTTTVLTSEKDLVNVSLPTYPFIIKPNNLGSSVGLYLVKNKKDFEEKVKKLFTKLKVKEVLIQEEVSGVEISCGCLEDINNDFTKLPPIEIQPLKSELFDYDAKYKTGQSREITPPISIDKKMSNKISELAMQIHIALRCKTYSRSDFIVKDKQIFYLETNTLPGMTKTSLLPQEAEVIGITFPQLLNFIITNS